MMYNVVHLPKPKQEYTGKPAPIKKNPKKKRKRDLFPYFLKSLPGFTVRTISFFLDAAMPHPRKNAASKEKLIAAWNRRYLLNMGECFRNGFAQFKANPISTLQILK